MNRFGHFLSASTFAAAAFGGDSFAASVSSAEDVTDQTVRQISATRFNVVPLNAVREAGTAIDGNPQSAQSRQLQASIMANQRLQNQLLKQHVDVTRVVAASRTPDGTLTFYTA